jgi:hypothetical protein
MARSPCRYDTPVYATGKVRLGDDFEGTHHIVGFVFEDVTVIEVFAGEPFEADDDAGDGAVGALYGVLPAEFMRLG